MEVKRILDKLLEFRIDCTDDAWEFAQFLVAAGLNFYHEETYRITNNWGMRVKRIPFFKENERHNILFDLGLMEKPYKQILKEKINRAIWVCDEHASCSFADMLCNYTQDTFEHNDNDAIHDIDTYYVGGCGKEEF